MPQSMERRVRHEMKQLNCFRKEFHFALGKEKNVLITSFIL